MRKTKKKILSIAAGVAFLGSSAFIPVQAHAEEVMWINHLDFLAGDPSVILSFNAVDSDVGGGLSGLIINSTTVGEDADGGGNKVIEKGLLVPPGNLVNGVRVCYELTSEDSFISQIRLAQVQDPSDTALILLDDGTDLTGQGPICVDSMAPVSGPIDPTAGSLRLSFRVNFANPVDDVSNGDTIVVRAVALNIIPEVIEDLQQQIDDLKDGLQNHAHEYLTGRGNGHNNTLATSGTAIIPSEPVADPVPFKRKVKRVKK
jgi:hypothetical protein